MRVRTRGVGILLGLCCAISSGQDASPTATQQPAPKPDPHRDEMIAEDQRLAVR